MKIDGAGLTIDNLYTLPTTAGTIGDVLTRSSGIDTIWSPPQIIGKFSQTSAVTVANTTTETSIVGAGSGSLSFPANYFTGGVSFRFCMGGVFRNNANNTVFRFRLRNAAVLFDSGNLTLNSIPILTAWNAELTFTHSAPSTLVTNF